MRTTEERDREGLDEMLDKLTAALPTITEIRTLCREILNAPTAASEAVKIAELRALLAALTERKGEPVAWEVTVEFPSPPHDPPVRYVFRTKEEADERERREERWGNTTRTRPLFYASPTLAGPSEAWVREYEKRKLALTEATLRANFDEHPDDADEASAEAEAAERALDAHVLNREPTP